MKKKLLLFLTVMLTAPFTFAQGDCYKSTIAPSIKPTLELIATPSVVEIGGVVKLEAIIFPQGNMGNSYSWSANNNWRTTTSANETTCNSLESEGFVTFHVITKIGECLFEAITTVEVIDPNSSYIYPNPTKDFLSILSCYPVERTEIYDQSGACVMTTENQTEKLNVSGLADGFYLIRVYVDGMPLTKKMIVRR